MMKRSKLGITGSHPIALVVGAGMAWLGHDVTICSTWGRAADEPRLGDLVRWAVYSGRLRIDPDGGMGEVDIAVVCGSCGDQPETLARAIPPECVVVEAPASACDEPEKVRRFLPETVHVVSQPLLLRPGRLVRDFLHPDRIVLGSDSASALDRASALYETVDAPIVRTDLCSAELAQHAINGYLAVKQRYLAALSQLCDAVGADGIGVARALSYDARIGDCDTAHVPASEELRHSVDVIGSCSASGRRLLEDATEVTTEITTEATTESPPRGSP